MQYTTKMNNQIDDLYRFCKIGNMTNAWPQPFKEILDAYNDSDDEKYQLQKNLLPEFYYGDYKDCSAVLLTHNPGMSTDDIKGFKSRFAAEIFDDTLLPSASYHSMATQERFGKETIDWITTINNGLHSFLQLKVGGNKLFIRDLVPFHSENFGPIDLSQCKDYIDDYFNQTVEASFNSTIYKDALFGCGKKHKKTLLFARGSRWNDAKGLKSVGWSFKESIGINGKLYQQRLLRHNVLILVITQLWHGHRRLPLSIYQPTTLNNLSLA